MGFNTCQNAGKRLAGLKRAPNGITLLLPARLRVLCPQLGSSPHTRHSTSPGALPTGALAHFFRRHAGISHRTELIAELIAQFQTEYSVKVITTCAQRPLVRVGWKRRQGRRRIRRSCFQSFGQHPWSAVVTSKLCWMSPCTVSATSKPAVLYLDSHLEKSCRLAWWQPWRFTAARRHTHLPLR